MLRYSLDGTMPHNILELIINELQISKSPVTDVLTEYFGLF